MTPFTDEEAAELLRESGAKLAETLGMREETDPTRVWEGQPVLLVTDDNIALGEVVLNEAEMRTYRSTTYAVRSTHFCDLYRNKFAITEEGWAKDPETTVLLPDGFTLYVGY